MLSSLGRGIASIGDLKMEMSRIISAISDPGPFISPPALRTRDRGACALSHTRSPRSPTPPCLALAAAWITQQRPPPPTVTYPPTAIPALSRSLSKKVRVPSEITKTSLYPSFSKHPTSGPLGSRLLALLPAHAQSPYPAQWDRDRREPRAPGSQLWEPAALLLSNTITAPTASRSSVGQQVQLGPP